MPLSSIEVRLGLSRPLPTLHSFVHPPYHLYISFTRLHNPTSDMQVAMRFQMKLCQWQLLLILWDIFTHFILRR